jgi:predicted nucleotidyltransferase
MNLPPDLAEMLAAFAAGGVRYLMIGGHAVSLHARARTTKDLDLWIDPARDNVARACEALRAFGIPDELVHELEVAAPSDIVWFGRAPARVDLLQEVPALAFAEAWANRVTIDLGGVAVTVIGRDDLMRNKRAVGRPQDLRDVAALERAAKRGAAGARSKRSRV